MAMRWVKSQLGPDASCLLHFRKLRGKKKERRAAECDFFLLLTLRSRPRTSATISFFFLFFGPNSRLKLSVCGSDMECETPLETTSPTSLCGSAFFFFFFWTRRRGGENTSANLILCQETKGWGTLCPTKPRSISFLCVCVFFKTRV